MEIGSLFDCLVLLVVTCVVVLLVSLAGWLVGHLVYFHLRTAAF
jgi:hypothetical protein